MSNSFEKKCPKCGNEDRIDIHAAMWVRLTSDGTDADTSACGEHVWCGDSMAACRACDYNGTVKDFEKAEPLPPDPEKMNDDRAKWALAAVRAFQAETGTDDETAIGDLISDLMHLCDRRKEFQEFAIALNNGQMHYEAETAPQLEDA